MFIFFYILFHFLAKTSNIIYYNIINRMTKKKVSIISHKRKKTSRVRNKVTRKTFKKK